jgi:hypothetical protein
MRNLPAQNAALMSFIKNKKHIDPQSTDWLFTQSYIQFVVNENGLDIQVTDAGFEYLEQYENDPDYFHQPEPELKRVLRRSTDFLIHFLLGAGFLVLFVYSIYKKIKE